MQDIHKCPFTLVEKLRCSEAGGEIPPALLAYPVLLLPWAVELERCGLLPLLLYQGSENKLGVWLLPAAFAPR